MTIEKIKIVNFKSPRTGKEVANQFIIKTEKGIFFQSYISIIAFIPKDREYDPETYIYHNPIQLDEKYWNYSKTTSKYRSEFLDENTKTTKEKIKRGEYILKNLNV